MVIPLKKAHGRIDRIIFCVNIQSSDLSGVSSPPSSPSGAVDLSSLSTSSVIPAASNKKPPPPSTRLSCPNSQKNTPPSPLSRAKRTFRATSDGESNMYS
mmetsp:Transcript_7818/g.11663  ORF Transcript_7818/g.11663 Transcript_7818/m.11663 type:complete len:100 (-) Transcript_7818:963-1262(-)